MTGEDICPDCGYDEGEHETECPIGSGHSREWWALLHRCEDPRWAVEQIERYRSGLEAVRDRYLLALGKGDGATGDLVVEMAGYAQVALHGLPAPPKEG